MYGDAFFLPAASLLASESSNDANAAKMLHSMGLLPKLLFNLCDPSMTVQKVQLICGVIASLLNGHFTPQDISRCRPPANALKKTSSLFFFDYNVSLCVQARTLPGLHSPVSRRR